MEKTHYDQLEETIYTEVLENGLKVILLPRPDFHKTYALFSTDFGSIDQHFVPFGKDQAVVVPDGIAHFLEHKMFEKEEGDVFHKFSKYGASANAFTSFTTTAYLFSATSHVEENLEILLDFVQEPYFTEASVEKEKGIIGQEIQMYDDMPDWRLMFGFLKNLYPDHPVSIDIAGTVDSIDQITADDLYENYHTFYHPSNMILFLTGPIDIDQISQAVKANQKGKSFDKPQSIRRIEAKEDLSKIQAFDSLEMDVSKAKVAVGIRGVDNFYTGHQGLKYELTMELASKLLFGTTSTNYLDLYDQDLIDDSYSFDFTYDRSFNFLMVASDTKEPDQFAERVQEILLRASTNEDINQAHFETVKKRTLGQALRMLNSQEAIAHNFISNHQKEDNIFNIVPTLEEISFSDVKEALDHFISKDYMTVFQILPK